MIQGIVQISLETNKTSGTYEFIEFLQFPLFFLPNYLPFHFSNGPYEIQITIEISISQMEQNLS